MPKKKGEKKFFFLFFPEQTLVGIKTMGGGYIQQENGQKMSFGQNQWNSLKVKREWNGCNDESVN